MYEARQMSSRAARSVRWWIVLVSFVLAGPRPFIHAEEKPMAASIQDNMDVGLEYTLTVDGAVVDSTDGRGAFHYIHGKGQILPGLERALTGLHVGDQKEVVVGPEEGYGAMDPAAVVEVPKTQLPADITPTVGIVLRGVNPEGKNFRASISEVKDQSVVLDLNHPLAGKTLTFNVKVAAVSPIPPQ